MAWKGKKGDLVDKKDKKAKKEDKKEEKEAKAFAKVMNSTFSTNATHGNTTHAANATLISNSTLMAHNSTQNQTLPKAKTFLQVNERIAFDEVNHLWRSKTSEELVNTLYWAIFKTKIKNTFLCRVTRWLRIYQNR